MGNAIVWFRDDLRLRDNPALAAALRAELAPVCVYVHAPDEEGDWAPGAASNAWRLRSLLALDADLRARGSRLHVFAGPSIRILEALAQAVNAEAVFWNRRYEPAIEQRDAAAKQALRGLGLHVHSHNGALLFEPWQLATRTGDPYKVFTPFWRMAVQKWQRRPLLEAPARLPCSDPVAGEVAIQALGLCPEPHWDAGFWQHWQPGEAGAHAALERFVGQAAGDYGDHRDWPAKTGTSRLSPHLHFGELAPWRVVHALELQHGDQASAAYVRQLGWREFAHHLLHHFPHSASGHFNSNFDRFPWREPSAQELRAWQRGCVGVPLVDAGLRELWATGWMHNRVRMVAASFLTKNQRAHWLYGARWFWDTLVDADLANNALGWQWVAGSGADAAPYVRVFNPVLQSQRFDPQGEYIARWVPELAGLPPAQRHAPWEAAQLVRGYPARPLVELAASRQAALTAYAAMR